jgi:pimeloyl-ACP methyl ester carboxylesterase
VSDRERFDTSGGEIAYSVFGEGPAVVLLHGFPLHSLTWRGIGPMLAPRFRVIVPDLLGSGSSAQPTDVPLGVRAQARYVRELLTELGVERFAVIGHGTGGAVAQALAAEGGAEAMVLLDAPRLDDAIPAMTEALETARGVPSDAVRGLFAAGTRRTGLISEDVIEAYARPFGPAPEALMRASQILEGEPFDGSEPPVADPDFPVMLLWGEEDPFVPVSVADRLNASIATSTLGLLPGCGHFLVEEASDTIAPLIAEYLRAMYLRAPHGHADEKAGVVMLQLERRPPWVDLAEDEADDWFVDDEEGDVP